MPTDSLPPEVRLQFEAHRTFEFESSEALRKAVDEYLASLEEAFVGDAVFNLELAQEIANGCRALLDDFDDFEEGARRDVQAAVTYFVDAEDDAGDLDSVMGFDDDARVFNMVARAVGREELVLDLD